jgi:hypothetical protein
MDDGIDPPIGGKYRGNLAQLAAGKPSGIGQIRPRPRIESLDGGELNDRFIEVEMGRFSPSTDPCPRTLSEEYAG